MNTRAIRFIGKDSVVSAALLLALVYCFSFPALAATNAGTVIKNQASATYRDSFGVQRVATSNIVETLIRQVAAIELSSDQTKPGAAGQEIFFTHTLVNTGNGADTFTLSVSNSAAGTYNLSSLLIYRDNDRNGRPDSYTPISTSDLLGPDQSQSLVISGIVPVAAVNGDTGVITLTAVSMFDNAVVASNTDTSVVTDSAVIELTKQLSALQGSSPDGPFTVSIFYRNRGALEATDVALIDALPQGMTYQAGSGRWSDSGNTILTDINPNDDQGGVLYCAYDNSCTGVPEADTDADSDSTNQVTAIIDVVPPGASGRLEFEVMLDAGLSSSILYNTAETEYMSGGTQSDRIASNSVPFRVLHGVQVVINGSNTSGADGTDEPREILESVFGTGSNLPECQSDTSDPDGDGYGWENSAQCIVVDLQAGNGIYFKNTVWNLGNATDTFDISVAASSFPQGSVFRLLQSDGVTPLLDTSGNGITDTGPMASGAAYEIVLHVILPAGITGDNAGVPFEVTTIATSIADATVSNSMLNLLHNISAGTVDLTNTAPLNDPLVTGSGAGPEVSPVTSVNAVSGETVLLDLYVNNTSMFPMAFDLAATIHSDFSSIELPPQWQLEFVLPDGSVVSNTGVVAPRDHLVVQARIAIPEASLAATTSIYFRVHNDGYSVGDIKHDAIVIAGQESIFLGINQEGQAQPGGARVYSHTLSNTGNANVNNISLEVSDSLAGWSSAIYEDVDNNGVLNSTDPMIGVTNLMVGETKNLFVKVFAPASAAEGQINFSVLTATWLTETLSVTDMTKVTLANLTVLKEQALDNGCDGILDSSYSSSLFSVEPGNNCVRYRLTANNNGNQSALNVVVADATPAFTTYYGSAVCSQANCTITEPGGGGNGDITATLPELVAGDAIVVEFMVRVD